jgi:hypothetical protein
MVSPVSSPTEEDKKGEWQLCRSYKPRYDALKVSTSVEKIDCGVHKTVFPVTLESVYIQSNIIVLGVPCPPSHPQTVCIRVEYTVAAITEIL